MLKGLSDLPLAGLWITVEWAPPSHNPLSTEDVDVYKAPVDTSQCGSIDIDSVARCAMSDIPALQNIGLTVVGTPRIEHYWTVQGGGKGEDALQRLVPLSLDEGRCRLHSGVQRQTEACDPEW